MQRNAKLTLAALILACTLPVVASYVTYYFWQPDDTMNYGELLEPQALPEATAEGIGGADIDLAGMRGHWTMVFTGAAACDEACGKALYAMRQGWLAQGEEMRRLERVWLVADDGSPAEDAVADQRGLKLARAVPAWTERLPGVEQGGHIYLVDPLGNVMMRFPPDPDVKRLIKDLQRLLKYSRLG